mgnify:CR=1 FL=1
MSKNDITGDKLVSKSQTKAFDEGFDRIWGKKVTPAHCMCPACKDGTLHWSDCSVHCEESEHPQPCDCGVINDEPS